MGRLVVSEAARTDTPAVLSVDPEPSDRSDQEDPHARIRIFREVPQLFRPE
jgi:hypothetical protein